MNGTSNFEKKEKFTTATTLVKIDGNQFNLNIHSVGIGNRHVWRQWCVCCDFNEGAQLTMRHGMQFTT